MGDAELLRELHDQYAGALWGYVVSLTGDRVRAQDVVQETLLRAWRNPKVLDHGGGSPRAWLFTVARRIVIDEWRTARQRHETVTSDVPEQSTADVSEGIVNRQLVITALRTLSQEHREVLLECYFRGASVQQAAETLGIAPGTVKSRTHYALRAVKAALAELGALTEPVPGSGGQRRGPLQSEGGGR